MKPAILTLLIAVCTKSTGQNAQLSGQVLDQHGESVPFAHLVLAATSRGVIAEEDGSYVFEDIPAGEYQLLVSAVGYQSEQIDVSLAPSESGMLPVILRKADTELHSVVISGTMKAVSSLDSPVPVEVYHPTFFRKNPAPNLYEALQNVNGVRPQLNCQVCHTGDIHINGLEGPNTMVLIDGMPIVSSLATVYGLSGIPTALIERVEVVKGPASSLYGSEAIGGLIHVITKSPEQARPFSAELTGTSWSEWNADLGWSTRFKNNRMAVLTGLNTYFYNLPIDHNEDNFTDVALQQRISLFQKWHFQRKSGKPFSIAGRIYRENRWGGELQWNPEYRGGDEIYGESIKTVRRELIAQYALPTREDIRVSFSATDHRQDAVYGNVPYKASQQIGFSQLYWFKSKGRHDLLSGVAIRFTHYDDNTPATEVANGTGNLTARYTWLPGIWLQDEIRLTENQRVLLGLRLDYSLVHRSIVTPRLAYQWKVRWDQAFRVNMGTGFRVVNLFTEEHAALTGAREVVLSEALLPERSYNVNIHYRKDIFHDSGISGSLEASAWCTYFSNIILPDYDSDPNQIIYSNLDGFALTRGISTNWNATLPGGWSLLTGATVLEVTRHEDGEINRQILTERFTATWTISYAVSDKPWSIDYSGNLYSPMLLPLLGPSDPRPAESPWWSIQNLQVTYKGITSFEIYGGVKNLLNWTPWKNNPQPIIARAFDPFDRDVLFDEDGQAIATPDNPYALTFDPSYVFAPNQGIRAFLGLRYRIAAKQKI